MLPQPQGCRCGSTSPEFLSSGDFSWDSLKAVSNPWTHGSGRGLPVCLFGEATHGKCYSVTCTRMYSRRKSKRSFKIWDWLNILCKFAKSAIHFFCRSKRVWLASKTKRYIHKANLWQQWKKINKGKTVYSHCLYLSGVAHKGKNGIYLIFPKCLWRNETKPILLKA